MTETTTANEKTIRVIEAIAGAASLIGIAGLIAMMMTGCTLSAHAAPPSPGAPPAADGGFQSGPRAFSNPNNPFAGAPPTGRPNTFFDEDEDDADFAEDFPPPAPPAGGGYTPPAGANRGAGAGSHSAGANSNAGSTSNNAISMGGTSPGGVISSGNQPKPISLDDETAEGSREIVTDFNFPDADIMDIAKTLGKLTGKNFILDKDVKGRITIISNSPITVGDAWKAFLTALDINGFALIPSGKYIRIARQRDARDKQLKTYTGDYSPDTDALITRVFPLKYLSSEEVARNFRSFMPANSRIIPYEQTNTVIVTDTGSNISKLQKLLEILDVEGYDAGIEVIPVKFASAAELSKLIDTLIPGTSAGPAGGASGGARFGGGKFSARRTKEGGIINTIISDERTNTLIVHANNKGADQVRELVTKLDQKLPAAAGGGKVHVVYLQFAEAEQISQTLNNLSSQTGGGFKAVSPGGGGGTGVNPVQASLFEGSIKVAADKATNSLVVTATPSDFSTIQRVINKLDIPRDQVFAEVVIMEVNISRDTAWSTNIINPSNGIALTPNSDLFDFIASPFAARGATLGFKGGNEREVSVGGQKIKVSGVQGLVRALQTNSNANVLATPQILTLDNTEATFESAEKVPVPTTTAVQGAVATSITKESVSLMITIKPQINKLSNFVKLDITTKMADFSGRELPAQVAQLALGTIERNAKTSVVVGDEDTIVLGGLTRDAVSDQVSKIPILGDIPVLGWLFKAKKTSSQKMNLLIFITPKIIRQYESIRTVLDKKLRDRDEFLEKNTGGEDPNRAYRDKMIRELPDINKLTTAAPDKFQTIDKVESMPLSGSGSGTNPDAPAAGTPPPGSSAFPIDGGNPPGLDAGSPPPPMDAPPPSMDSQPPGGP